MIPSLGRGPGWRRYTMEFGAAMALYVVAVMATVRIYNQFDPRGVAALALSLVPMVPTVLAMWAVLRQFWRLDELERRIVSEALVVAAIIVALLSFAVGWMLVIVQPDNDAARFLPLLLVLPSLCAVWGVALRFVRRRYS